MLEVKKCGKTDYGYWATGTLEYQELVIISIFKVNKELVPGSKYDVQKIIINNSRIGMITFKLEI